MLTLPPSVKIWLATEPVDMRKGFNGLTNIARGEWSKDPYSGHLFVFIGRGRDRIKVLYFDRGGFVLHYKRLERGRFQMPAGLDKRKTVTLEAAELTMLLSGIDLNARRLSAWQPSPSAIDNGC